MKAKQMLVFYFFIGIDDDVHYVYTAQTFATLQFVAFIISYLYVPNMGVFLCADFFFKNLLSCHMGVNSHLQSR